MRTRHLRALAFVFAVACCLALIPSAVATTASGVKTVYLTAPVEALAINGNRVAYDVQSTPPSGSQGEIPNGVLVWNTGRGTTTQVSGRATATADGTTGGGVDRLAIAGNRVAWRVRNGGNTESSDDIYTSSLLSPRERHVARGTGESFGPGTWLAGVLTSGSDILVDRWTTAAGGGITGGGLYKLHGTRLRRFITGATAVEAVAADARRVAVEHYADSSLSVFSTRSGQLVTTIAPAAQAQQVALSGRNLLVLEPGSTLVLYDAQTGALKKTFTLHRRWQGEAIAVHGNVAVYSSPATSRPENSVRALNLTTGKDALVGRLPGQIPLLCLDSHGLACVNNEYRPSGYDIELVFRPFAEVAALVR